MPLSRTLSTHGFFTLHSSLKKRARPQRPFTAPAPRSPFLPFCLPPPPYAAGFFFSQATLFLPAPSIEPLSLKAIGAVPVSSQVKVA